jgi:phage repressor protein C with HTH and peptisase S24 domain
MKNRNYRLKKALESAGVSQEKLAKVLDKTSQAVNERLNKDREVDSLKLIEAVAMLTGYSFEWLRSGEGPETAEEAKRSVAKKVVGALINMESMRREDERHLVEEKDLKYLKGELIRPVSVTVDRSGKELITYVPVKAQAGYRKGYADPQFIQKLPAFSLPVIINHHATNRMFQVDGNSMRQLGGGGLNDGDIVFAEYVEDIFNLKDGRVYVVVTTEEVFVKRVINRLKTEAKVLILNSDNKSGDYAAIVVHPGEIREVWEYKAHLSRQLPMNTDLFDTINDLQVKQALLEDRLKEIEQKRVP